MSEDTCTVCKRIVLGNQHDISCDICDQWTHTKCGTGITRRQYLYAQRNGEQIEFVCTACVGEQEPMQVDEVTVNFDLGTTLLSESASSTRQDEVQENAYSQHDSLYKNLRKLFALQLLPTDDIPRAFEKLQAKSQSAECEPLFSYVRSTWFESSVWDVDPWSVFGRSVRTNNNCEGWHNRLNQRAKKGNLPFYLLVTLLYTEAKDVPLNCKLIKERKLRRVQSRNTRLIQGQLFELWGRYSSNDISTSHLLSECARLYGPV